MFHYLFGTLAVLEPAVAVIDCSGVGYKLTISGYTYTALARDYTSQTAVKLYTHMSVREDAVELFGFADETELTAFRALTTVSGVGPKAALAILTALDVQGLVNAIANNDPRAISAANGVGAKTASRVILELTDKLSAQVGITPSGVATPSPSAKGAEAVPAILQDARNALMVLGYSRSEATSALGKIDLSGMSLEEIVRTALAVM